MQVLFLDAPYSGKVELSQETLDYLKKQGYTKVGLYASVQFVNQLGQVKQQLQQHSFQIITSKADRTNVEGQILGCDNYHNSLNLNQNIDCYLYVGDGKFHPLALVYTQKDSSSFKEVIINDPLTGQMSLMTLDDIKTILKKYKASLIKFLASETVGVLNTIKPGQEQFRPGLELEKKYPDKKFYFFVDNVVSFNNLEDFNFIDCWVNTTCPRVGFDDQEKFQKGVVNLNDALAAKEILGKDSLFTRL